MFIPSYTSIWDLRVSSKIYGCGIKIRKIAKVILGFILFWGYVRFRIYSLVVPETIKEQNERNGPMYPISYQESTIGRYRAYFNLEPVYQEKFIFQKKFSTFFTNSILLFLLPALIIFKALTLHFILLRYHALISSLDY